MKSSSGAELDKIIRALLAAPDRETAYRLLVQYQANWADVDARLVLTIAARRREQDIWSMAALIGCRGLLRRYHEHDANVATARQAGWPLQTQAPLLQLLALRDNVPADTRIRLAAAALDDMDPEREADWSGFAHYHLGLGWQARAEGNASWMLDRAIGHWAAAVQAWTAGKLFGPKFLGRAQHNLGRLYLERRHGERSRDIETGLCWLKQAQEMLGDPGDQIQVLILLGNAYSMRIEGERLYNLERSIGYYQQAHGLAQGRGDSKRAQEIEHNLSVAYRLRLGGDPADNYEQAIAWAEQALGHPGQVSLVDMARTLGELATIYSVRRRGERRANLEQAITYARQALDTYRPDTHLKEWSAIQLVLGNLYCDRLSGRRGANEKQAIECFQSIRARCREADPLRWAEATNNLGTIYAARADRAGDDHYQKAVDCYCETLHVHTPQALPAQALPAAKNWGGLAFRHGQWQEAWDALKKAIEAGEVLYQASSTEAGRRVELAESAGVAAQAAYCLLKLGRRDLALLTLEHSKTRMLSEALSWEGRELQALPGAQREAIRSARARVRTLEAEMRSPSETPTQEQFLERAERLRQARAALREQIATVQQERPDFMPSGLDLPAILDLIPEGGALVMPLISARGCAAFVLPHGTREIEARHVVWRPAFTQAAFLALLLGTPPQSGEWGWLSGYVAYQEHKISWQDCQAVLERCTRQLWAALMGPIHDRLIALGLRAGAPVVVIPQGGLGLLPLHAAWREAKGAPRAFLDEHAVSYAPSAYTLAASRRRLQDERRRRPSLLAVVDPTADLPFTAVESQAVAALFPEQSRRTLAQDQATPEAVVEAAPGHSYLHFACHGFYDWDEVLHSGLLLSGGPGRAPLSLADIFSRLDLSAARLVALSACETGLAEFQESPDEYIGLPAGFLQAGAPAVIGTLWSVPDLSTALLMERFYVNHLRGDPDEVEEARKPLPPAEALRRAQVWLRDQVTTQVVANRSMMEMDRLRGRDELVLRHLAPAQQEYALRARRTPLDRPFAHPYYWAPFALAGAGFDDQPTGHGEERA